MPLGLQLTLRPPPYMRIGVGCGGRWSPVGVPVPLSLSPTRQSGGRDKGHGSSSTCPGAGGPRESEVHSRRDMTSRGPMTFGASFACRISAIELTFRKERSRRDS
jgi:hypothetical protein